jgi:hypothetical protein
MLTSLECLEPRLRLAKSRSQRPGPKAFAGPARRPGDLDLGRCTDLCTHGNDNGPRERKGRAGRGAPCLQVQRTPSPRARAVTSNWAREAPRRLVGAYPGRIAQVKCVAGRSAPAPPRSSLRRRRVSSVSCGGVGGGLAFVFGFGFGPSASASASAICDLATGDWRTSSHQHQLAVGRIPCRGRQRLFCFAGICAARAKYCPA